MPASLFQSVRFLTTAVASEMSYSQSGLQRQALFSIALVLFLFIMLINAALNFFLKRRQIEMISKKRKLFLWPRVIACAGCYLATALTAGLTLFHHGLRLWRRAFPTSHGSCSAPSPATLPTASAFCRTSSIPCTSSLYTLILVLAPWRGRGDLPDGVRPQQKGRRGH